MAKKKQEQNKLELEPKAGNQVLPVNIVTEMKDSYISYAMSVITGRALPDVRDGLKPVHRRILYAMHEMGLTASAKFRKSAAVVGDVLGKYHPHGDSSVYEAMVNMAQTFSFRYPLILGQGNFGSIDGDGAAAMRYTEAKMSKISGELLKDLDKETVAWRPNYDGTRKEPVVLPAGLPALLLNGTLGIAVGMATNIPPHNLGELVDACIHMVEHPSATTEDLMEFVKGPDFPLGGIVYGSKDMFHAYSTGRGGIVCRGEAEMIEMKNGSFNIEITSIPYRVNKSDFIMSIADLVQEKKIEGIKDIRDLSTKDIKIVIELKPSAFPQKVLNILYKHTQLEQNFNLNMVALNMGQPETMSLADMISYFVDHRFEVVRRRTEFDLKKAKDREHILLGLKKALDHIDKIITTIRESKDASVAKVNLIKVFKFSDLQADAILEMRLQKLAGLERKQVETELAEKQKLIGELESLLSSDKKIRTVIAKELGEMKDKYADDRRTKIIKSGVKQLSEEDLIPDKEAVLVYTAGGYVKRTDPGEYRAQRRGGVGVIDLETKEEDFVTQLVGASTHDDLLFFTNLGKTYQIKMYDIPEGRRATKGKSIMNFLSLAQDERVTSILPMSKSMKEANVSMILVTANGIAKKVKIDSFKDVRRSGLIAITLEKGDSLVAAKFVEKGDDVSLVSSEGQSIRFKESDVREMGRQALGVTAMKLDKGDLIIGVGVIRKEDKDASILTISEHGLGKMTYVSEYKTQKRGGSGIATSKVTNKTGKIMNALIIKDETEIIAMSKKGQVIRTELKSIPVLGRSTQGVTIMKLREGDSIASIVCA